jgi:N-acetylglucosamine kinase-like BadF-type ATPase
MKEDLILGVDVGSSKTHAVIADLSGRALGFGRGGSGNHEVVGYEGFYEAMRQATQGALSSAGVGIERIAGAGFGVSGYDWPPERQPTLDTIARLGLSCPYEAVNDTVLGLIAGATEGWGLALVGGTGCNCRGLDPQGREGRVTGNGDAFGEFGGAGSVVFKALHAVSYEWSRRGSPTALTPAFIAWCGARDVDDLIEGLVLERYRLDSDVAPLVFQVAESGDPIAQDIIRWAGSELGEMAVGVIRQLGIQELAFDVVLIGSLFDGGPLYTEPLRQVIQRIAPRVRLKRLEAPPVAGGVMLGMRQAGQDPVLVRQALLESTAQIIGARDAERATLPSDGLA